MEAKYMSYVIQPRTFSDGHWTLPTYRLALSLRLQDVCTPYDTKMSRVEYFASTLVNVELKTRHCVSNHRRSTG